MERKNQRISDLFYNNRFLLVFSVVAAVALWLVIAVEYGPESTKTVDVPVQANFEYINKQYGLTCYGDYDKSVKVTIKGQRVVVDSDDIVDQIEAVLELGAVTRSGEFPVAISVKKTRESFSDFEIIGTSASAYYNLFFDKENNENGRTIEADIECSAASGRVILDAKVSPEKINISGPISKISEIARVVVKENIAAPLEKTEIIEKAKIQLLDRYGNVINPEENYITLSVTEASVTIPVYHTQTMKTGCTFTNKPAKYLEEKYEPFKITVSPSVVDVDVSESLKGLDILEVCKIDYSEIENVSYFKKTIPVSDINGCNFRNGVENITVIVDASNLADKVVPSPDIANISFENEPEGKDVVPVSIDFEAVRMIGPKESIDALDVNELKLTVDLSSLPENAEGNVKVKAFAESDDCWSFGNEYIVTVNVK